MEVEYRSRLFTVRGGIIGDDSPACPHNTPTCLRDIAGPGEHRYSPEGGPCAALVALVPWYADSAQSLLRVIARGPYRVTKILPGDVDRLSVVDVEPIELESLTIYENAWSEGEPSTWSHLVTMDEVVQKYDQPWLVSKIGEKWVRNAAPTGTRYNWWRKSDKLGIWIANLQRSRDPIEREAWIGGPNVGWPRVG